MKHNTKFVGLDVSKNTIAVAVAEEGREASRYIGQVPNTFDSVRKLLSQLNEGDSNLAFCYEAGPTGYGLYRFLTSLGIECIVVAPSLIPTRAGDKVKTDRRDAMRLAQLHRAGELTPVYVPTEEDEALRDLVRARETANGDLLRARHHLSKFLLRHEIKTPKHIKTKWTKVYREWLNQLTFANEALTVVYQEYKQIIFQIEERIRRFEKAIHEEAMASKQAPLIQALQTLRGVKEVTAVTLVTEIGSFKRFSNPQKLMGYIGLIPSEYSSGMSRYQGKITKNGNRHIRRVLVEAAWGYRLDQL